MITGAEERTMEVRDGAELSMRSQIGLQPFLLQPCWFTASTHRVLAVQRHNVPVTEVEAVVSLAGRTSARAEVVVVRKRARRVVLVVSGRRMHHTHNALTSPRLCEAVLELDSGPD